MGEKLQKKTRSFSRISYCVLSSFSTLSLNSHGTEVAGIIAAEANNDVCIVGVAHASRIIGNN